jgi:3-dehydrosphinganine reductase
MPRYPFDDKSIFITGGSRGIGLGLAIEFAKAGAKVAIAARNRDDLAAAKTAIEAQQRRAERVRTYACDVTDASAVGECIKDAVAAFGGLHGVVANSGYCHPGRFHELSVADFDRQIDTNFKGTVYTLRHAIPHVLEARGFVAITSSPAGKTGFFGFGAYGPTKAALNNLSEVLRAEYGYAEEPKLYPPETRAILAGGSVHETDAVARTFVAGIAKGKEVISIGFETKLLFASLRFAPFVWNAHVRRAKRKARRRQLESD